MARLTHMNFNKFFLNFTWFLIHMGIFVVSEIKTPFLIPAFKLQITIHWTTVLLWVALFSIITVYWSKSSITSPFIIFDYVLTKPVNLSVVTSGSAITNRSYPLIAEMLLSCNGNCQPKGFQSIGYNSDNVRISTLWTNLWGGTFELCEFCKQRSTHSSCWASLFSPTPPILRCSFLRLPFVTHWCLANRRT